MPPPGVEGFPPFFPSTPFISPLLSRKVSLPFFLATLFFFCLFDGLFHKNPPSVTVLMNDAILQMGWFLNRTNRTNRTVLYIIFYHSYSSYFIWQLQSIDFDTFLPSSVKDFFVRRFTEWYGLVRRITFETNAIFVVLLSRLQNIDFDTFLPSSVLLRIFNSVFLFFYFSACQKKTRHLNGCCDDVLNVC